MQLFIWIIFLNFFLKIINNNEIIYLIYINGAMSHSIMKGLNYIFL